MKQQTRYTFFSILLLTILPFSTQAHTTATMTLSFNDGFIHPWLGVDHILSLLAIGLWASLMGKRALWLLPGCFLVAMAIGALLNFSGLLFDNMELWVAFSVLVLGVLVFHNPNMPIVLAATLVISLALGHGYVHAAEISHDANSSAYALGFLTATATLHGIGIFAGLSSTKILMTIRTGFGLFCAITGLLLINNV